MKKKKQCKKPAKTNNAATKKGFCQMPDASSITTDKYLLAEKFEYELDRAKKNEEGMIKLEEILGISQDNYRGREASEASILLCERAIELNLYAELKGTFNYPSPFNNARAALFVAVGQLILEEGILTKTVLDKIKAAGQMLWESGGMRDMQDPLVWLFIPEALHPYIVLAWNGIGVGELN